MIYLDNHATTRCDPRVVEAMIPWLTKDFGNPHSDSHDAGRRAAEGVAQATAQLASRLGAAAESIVYTSGATESNNLAIRGVCLHPRQKRRHLVTATTEHPAVLDVCEEMQRQGFRVSRVPVHPVGSEQAGTIDLDELAAVVDEDTALVSVMWANNEMGAIHPISQIAEIVHGKGALLHSDAAQAVGRLPVDLRAADVDLLSASAHKFYGPKGTGLLIVGNGNRRVRLKPEIVGGGQQRSLRSGTLNPAGIVAMSTALRLCQEESPEETRRIARLTQRFHQRLSAAISGLQLNGPPLAAEGAADASRAEVGESRRLPGNLNVMLPAIEGEAWMAAAPEIAFSSGSACSSADALPSHVLLEMGRSESEARRSVRFGLGRFTTDRDIDSAAEMLIAAYERIAQFSR